ncbi:P-loop containing nucleoside triphosphate hydrolase protein, partial [Corynespora cassiicola Philippines]
GSLPSALLESFIPGYGIFAKIMHRTLGFDIGLVVSGYLGIYALIKAGKYVYDKAEEIFLEHFTSTVEIEILEPVYADVMDWIRCQRIPLFSRDQRVLTDWLERTVNDEERKAAEELEDGVDNDADDGREVDADMVFRNEHWAASIPIFYEPGYGFGKLFWFNGRIFSFGLARGTLRYDWGDHSYRHNHMYITSIGRSDRPIRRFLKHVQTWAKIKESMVTKIFRPKTDGGYCEWACSLRRPTRKIDTVTLGLEAKRSLLKDISEYIQPETAQWYGDRGIPHRRGYLFYGPPGTGKSSLSLALAGLFGLRIYFMSLAAGNLDESDLIDLFATLPRRCIVLLEDIDAAGLTRTGQQPAKDDDDSNCPVSVSIPEHYSPNKKTISLSGLLNLIDGASAQEGRILIMTTNHRERFDAALTRPGRIDYEVKFTNATQEQAADIFVRMFAPPSSGKKKKKVVKKEERDAEKQRIIEGRGNDDGSPEAKELRERAGKFAKEIPEGKVSPAEIQGFLLVRKGQPAKALEEVKEWVRKLLE